jgi:hypothetical protein
MSMQRPDIPEHLAAHPWVEWADRETARADAAEAELARLRAEINTPHTAKFVEAVMFEAEHQRGRWGTAHDAGKTAPDWFWLLGYLAGKALAAWKADDRAKMLHHIVTVAAACLNWHGHETGASTSMRPGLEPPAGGQAP